jgi:hypothetical protein
MPIHVGAYRLKKYLGFPKRSPTHQGHHKYRVECLSCGLTHEMLQDSLIKSERNNVDKCNDCKERIIKESQRARYEKAFNEWVKLMMEWPSTAIEFRKGFDSERQATTHPVVFDCNLKR